jgi:ribosomal protein S18 acetylase RimI-like enzyme
MLVFKTLEGTVFEVISECFNHAFRDYLVPLTMSPDQLMDKFQNEGGRLDLSVGVFEGDQLVGFILHFVAPFNQSYQVYNGGTGVIPSFRGIQLTVKMYEFIFPKLIEHGAVGITLEVIETNANAIAVYEKLGFKKIRTLNCYKGQLDVPGIASMAPGYHIKEVNEMPLELFTSFWDHPPSWQNGNMAMKSRQPQLTCTVLMKNSEAVGYLIYHPKMKRIHQLAIDQRYRNLGLASYLLSALATPPTEAVSIINIDSRCIGLCLLMEKFGLTKTVTQFEMECLLQYSY